MKRMSLIHFFFSFRGRITRFEWWLGSGILTALTILVVRIIDPGLFAGLEARDKFPRPPSLPVTVWNVLICYPSAAMSAKRFNDRDLPIWNGYLLGLLLALLAVGNYFGYLLDTQTMTGGEKLLFMVILGYSLWAFFDNGFRRGTRGHNRHGFDPSY